MHPEIQVRIRSDSLPKAGVLAGLRFTEDSLLLDGDVSLAVNASHITVTVGGFNDDQLFLSWQDAQCSWSIEPVSASDKLALIEHCPGILSPQMQQARKTIKTEHFRWNSVLTIAITFMLSIILVIWQLDRIERWLAAQVSPATEKRLGQMTLASLKKQSDLEQDSAAAKAVAEIGGRLTKGSRYQYQWYIKQDDDINAFAIPSGIVVVHSGLIAKAGTPEELAGALAHEVQHIEQRHSLQHLIHSGGLAAVLAITLGDVSGVAAVLLHSVGSTRNSRELEAQADSDGVKALVAAGISPKGMADFFARIMKESKDQQNDGLGQFLSSHPATAERLQAINKDIALQPCQCKPLKMDWTAIQASVLTNKDAPAGERKGKQP